MTGRVTRERSFRGISRRLAAHYLVNLGGERVAPDRVVADDWTADLTESAAAVGPTLTITEVHVRFEGDAAALEDLIERFARKAMRAGG